MEQNSNFFCKIYVDNDEIYSGDLGEIPEKFRARIVSDITEWAYCLGKSGTNELLYSHLIWYNKKGSYCEQCDTVFADSEVENCETCTSDLEERFIYARNDKIEKILTCIGMITKIEVLNN